MKAPTQPDSIQPRYQFLEGCLEDMQEAANEYAKNGWRLVGIVVVKGATLNEYCAVMEREPAKAASDSDQVRG